MAHNNFIFLKHKQLNLPEFVYLGDDTTQDIVGEGNAYIFLSQGEISTVCEVLYIPHLRENLFFVKHHGGIHVKNGKGLFWFTHSNLLL